MEQSLSNLQLSMYSLVSEWQLSGKTQTAFCKEMEIGYAKFQYWLAKYRLQNAEPDVRAFTQVKVNAQRVPGGAIELFYPDGRKLVFNQAVDVHFLRSLLS